MQTKTYIIIVMIIVLFILTYQSNIFNKQKEQLDATNNIIKPDNTNIDNLDIKQLKNVINEQNKLIDKQSEVINNYVTKIEKNNNRFSQNVIKPSEDIEKYFNDAREENDKIIKNNQHNEEESDITQKYKINIVKRYLEDPIMRGSNIYESEQYSKLLEIGNIKIDNKINPPNPKGWSININK